MTLIQTQSRNHEKKHVRREIEGDYDIGEEGRKG